MKNTVILLALVLVAPMAFAQEQKQATAPAAQAVQDASKGSIQYQGRTHNLVNAETLGPRYHSVAPNTVQTVNTFVEQLTPKERQLLRDDLRDPGYPVASRHPSDITITDITVEKGANPRTVAKNEVNDFASNGGFATVRNTKDPNNLSVAHMESGGLGYYEVRTCTVEGCHVRSVSERGQLAPGWQKLNEGQLKDVLQTKINESGALQSVKLDPGVDRR